MRRTPAPAWLIAAALILSLQGCGEAEPTKAPPAADDLGPTLAAWDAAFDRSLEVRGDHVAGGADAAIVVMRGLASQFEATREQNFPATGGGAPPTPEPSQQMTVVRTNPDVLEAVARVRELASFDATSRGGAEGAEWIERLEGKAYDLRVAMAQVDKLPRTVEVEAESLSQPPPALEEAGEAALMSARSELQLRTMARFNADAAEALRARRAQILAADEVLELASQAIDAAVDTAPIGDANALERALDRARGEYVAATEEGDVEALAAASNKAASALHAVLQSRAIRAADVELLEKRRVALVSALEQHPATHVVRSLPEDRIEVDVSANQFREMRRVSIDPDSVPLDRRVVLEEAYWERCAASANDYVAALALDETDREIEDSWHRNGLAELLEIDARLVEDTAKLLELEQMEQTTRATLAAARESYARAAKAQRAYVTAQRRAARASLSGE